MSDPKSLAEESSMKTLDENESSTKDALMPNDPTPQNSLESSSNKSNGLPISFNLGPNISLSIRKKAKEEETTDEEEDPSHTTPSPKPETKVTPKKLSVKQRKAKLEENIRNQNKNMKDLTKETSEAIRLSRACEKMKESKTKEDPFSIFMKEFRTRMDRMDRKQETMNEKIDTVSTRIERIESHARKQDKAYKKEFENIRAEINTNNLKLDESVTNNVIQTFQPKI